MTYPLLRPPRIWQSSVILRQEEASTFNFWTLKSLAIMRLRFLSLKIRILSPRTGSLFLSWLEPQWGEGAYKQGQGQGCWILEFLHVVYGEDVVSTLSVCTEPLLLLLESLWNYFFFIQRNQCQRKLAINPWIWTPENTEYKGNVPSPPQLSPPPPPKCVSF